VRDQTTKALLMTDKRICFNDRRDGHVMLMAMITELSSHSQGLDSNVILFTTLFCSLYALWIQSC